MFDPWDEEFNKNKKNEVYSLMIRTTLFICGLFAFFWLLTL